MTAPPSARDVLDREFLELRSRLLEAAAAMDRLDRAEGHIETDSRWRQIMVALRIIANEHGNRAEQLQMAFSLPYDSNWLDEFHLRRASNGKDGPPKPHQNGAHV